MATIFVRERGQVGEGMGRPRFRVVAAAGADLRVFAGHLRRSEIEQIASATGAEVIYLSRGEHAEGSPTRRGAGQRHRRNMDG